ncbi:MmgE/PrpD family protein [Roseomonas sp. CAU 1739]|uniref:MmgE/PrpD family protein n=1 Tax=Roseomonas sp. CAU 1739 TaxID=3140364 RepID=UPI00325A4CAE
MGSLPPGPADLVPGGGGQLRQLHGATVGAGALSAFDIDQAIAFAWNGPPPGSVAAGKARLLLVDSLGCMLAGLGHQRPRDFGAALAATMPGPIRVAGVAAGLSQAGAAALLAAAMCWDEANEGLARAHGRPALAVAPLCIAALAEGRATIGEALAAFVLGYEVAGRAGEAWRIRPGMHVDGSWHSLGAAAAAARLAGGDPAAVARAVHIAGCQVPFSLYAPIAAGMDGRNTYPGHAVLLGTLAAAGAIVGMDAPAAGFAEARRLALGLDQDAMLTPPDRWLLEDAYIKPFAGVRHAHYAAAAAIALRAALGLRLAEVRSVTLATYAEALRYAANRAPVSAIPAQFSLSWAMSAALVQGDLGPAAYADTSLADPVLRGIEAMVTLIEDPGLTESGDRGAGLAVTLQDGTVLEARADQVPGDPALPMSVDAVCAKFLRFATPVLGEAQARAVLVMLLDGAPADGLAGLLLSPVESVPTEPGQETMR